MNNKSPVKITILITQMIGMLVSCEQNVSTSPPIELVPLGFIYIESSPPGMKIYEDGRNSGKVTPDSLNWLAEREYAITLKKKYFRDTTISVDVIEEIKKKLSVDYYSNPQMLGGLECKSNPTNSSIIMNDSLT